MRIKSRAMKLLIASALLTTSGTALAWHTEEVCTPYTLETALFEFLFGQTGITCETVLVPG